MVTNVKSIDEKTEFIRLRAEGKSYGYIAKELGMSKDTCSRWERELSEKIAELKSQNLDELYESFYMTKEARVKKLGNTLSRIDNALEQADLSEMEPKELLDYKLKYTDALKKEYIPTVQGQPLKEGFNSEDIMNAVADLLNRVRNGDVTAEQANRESLVLSNLLKAYDSVIVQQKLDALEAVVQGRP